MDKLKWKPANQPEKGAVRSLCKEIGLSEMVTKILVQRGFETVEQTETFESSQRLIATPKRCMTSTFVERQSEKITPKMREGRAIIEGKSENLKPLERITAGGSEAPPRWQCNMCKRIFQQEWKQ